MGLGILGLENHSKSKPLGCDKIPQSQIWAELALFLIPPADWCPPGLVVNKQEISSTCFVKLVGQI
jgi:hypothetical protein